MRISLCLLVWNELQGVKTDIPRIPQSEFDEIYAIDGGSTDGTVEYLEANGIPVFRQPKRGLNAAYIHAVDRSTCDAVVVFFPKGTLPVEDLLNFRSPLEAGYELVIASRNIENAKNKEDENLFKPRKWSVQILSLLAALFWWREGNRVHDVLHGVKGFTLDAFNRIAPCGEGLSIDIEMVVRSYKLRLKRIEIPIREGARQYGSSHFRYFPTGIRLARYFWNELWRHD